MHNRSSSQWQSRRNHSIALGPVRRAHPASGATWNVQVVRGKITSRCLWHACRALAIGIVLMLLGAGMATIGYYADELSVGREIRGNATVRVKNESRGFHLNNLSYAGPIVMGVGGFIVVAACVMTFEARDSAAKVVPARFKVSTGRNNNNFSKSRTNSSSSRRTARWEHQLGVFRTSPACEAPQVAPPPAREALTAALVHFSKALGTPTPHRSSTVSPRRISRSGSVPNLLVASNRASTLSYVTGSPASRRCSSHQHHHHHHTYHPHHGHRSSSRTNSISSRCVKNSNDTRLLHPGMLQLHRQALSVDETGPYYKVLSDSMHDSKNSVAIEVHGLGPGTAFIINEAGVRSKDRTKRSDIARRHVLSRQKPVEKEEPHSPRNSYHSIRRRSSGASDLSNASKRLGRRRASSVSRTPSIDSRVGIHRGASSSVAEINNSTSPEQFCSSPRTPRHQMHAQYSTPSVEREFRSQLSVCSDPTNTVRQLSCQSSIEPCVPEESPDQEETEEAILNNSNTNKLSDTSNTTKKIKKPSVTNPKPMTTTAATAIGNSKPTKIKTIIRPETLTLQIDPQNTSVASTSSHEQQQQQTQQTHKYLYRSNSTRSFKKKPKPKLKLSSELYEQIYFIGNNRTDDDNYNSIEVIDERRRKNFTRNAISESCTNNVVYDNTNTTNLNSSNSNLDSTNIKGLCDDEKTTTTTAPNEIAASELVFNINSSVSSNGIVNDVVSNNTICSDSENLQETIDSKNSACTEAV